MPTRTVVKRTRRVDRRQKKGFIFSREMVEAISGNGNVPEFIKEYRSQAWDEFEKLPIDLIIGDKKIRQSIENLDDIYTIEKSWLKDLKTFEETSRRVHLYT